MKEAQAAASFLEAVEFAELAVRISRHGRMIA